MVSWRWLKATILRSALLVILLKLTDFSLYCSKKCFELLLSVDLRPGNGLTGETSSWFYSLDLLLLRDRDEDRSWKRLYFF